MRSIFTLREVPIHNRNTFFTPLKFCLNKPFLVFSRILERAIEVTKGQFLALMEIECANFLDQVPPASELSEALRARFGNACSGVVDASRSVAGAQLSPKPERTMD